MKRGLAIEAYAGLESALNYLFGHLLETSPDKAGVVFFRVVNSRARNTMLEDLLDKKHRKKYDDFFRGISGAPGQKRQPGLFAMITALDQQRNEIVHWHTVFARRRVGETQEELRPHVFWSTLMEDEPARWYGKKRLQSFIDKTDFVAATVWAFYRVMENKLDGLVGDPAAWAKVFEAPPVYPAPEAHPLYKPE